MKVKILKFEWTGRNYKLYIDNEYSHTNQTERALLAEVINDYFGTEGLDPKKYSGLKANGFVSGNASFAEMKEILAGMGVDYTRDGNNIVLTWSE